MTRRRKLVETALIVNQPHYLLQNEVTRDDRAEYSDNQNQVIDARLNFTGVVSLRLQLKELLLTTDASGLPDAHLPLKVVLSSVALKSLHLLREHVVLLLLFTHVTEFQSVLQQCLLAFVEFV